MNVKELKQILENANDDAIVKVSIVLGHSKEANYVRVGVGRNEVEIGHNY